MFFFGDNQPVLADTYFPRPTLENSYHIIEIHFIREGVANN